MRKTLALVMAATMALSLAACSNGGQQPAATSAEAPKNETKETEAAAPSGEVIHMKLAHQAATDHPANIAAQQFAEKVGERTNGMVEIEIFPNNELGSPDEQLEQSVLGVVDMSLPTQGCKCIGAGVY